MNAHELSLFKKSLSQFPNVYYVPEPDNSSNFYSVIPEVQYDTVTVGVAMDTVTILSEQGTQNSSSFPFPKPTGILTLDPTLKKKSWKSGRNELVEIPREATTIPMTMSAEESQSESQDSNKWRRNCLICSFIFLLLANLILSSWLIFLYASGEVGPGQSQSQQNKGKEIKGAPRFFEDVNYSGRYFTAPPNWETSGCINFPGWFNNVASSVETGGHCLFLFEHENCQNYVPFVSFGTSEKIYEGSYSHNNLAQIQLDKRISSFRLC